MRHRMFLFLQNQALGSVPLVFVIFVAAHFPGELDEGGVATVFECGFCLTADMSQSDGCPHLFFARLL
jgi:hypothetical protein